MSNPLPKRSNSVQQGRSTEAYIEGVLRVNDMDGQGEGEGTRKPCLPKQPQSGNRTRVSNLDLFFLLSFALLSLFPAQENATQHIPFRADMDTGHQPMQGFRCCLTDDVLHIATRLDPKTGERVVLWRDIQAGFENLKSIRNGRSVIPLLTDEDLLEIIPHRIAYYPGVVLEVIVDGHGRSQRNSQASDPGALASREPHQQTDSNDTCTQPFDGCTATSFRMTPAPTFMDNNTESSPLVLYSPSNDGNHPSSAVLSNPQLDPSLRDVMTAQVSMQATVQQALDRQYNQIEQLQKQLVQSQLLQQETTAKLVKNQEEMKEMQRRQQETAEQLVKKQEEMNEMQKMAIDRLAIIQSRVQAVAAQTYELHEYPIPRLFIVLPKTEGMLDKITNPFSHQFRVYFLCECGAHTMDENSKTHHEIHLAKHEGYDLEKPNEFFERYGSYVLTLLNMIKYGVTAAGLIVPPLSGLKIVEGIDASQQHMDYLKKNIGPLVDNTISYLDGKKRKTELGEESASSRTEFSQLEALEGADLRQLESYLKVKDSGRVLANLYRIVTSEGHVKWVCIDHYKATYRASSIQHLKEVVSINRGTFIEETGRIEIKIATSTLAKQFYDAMIKARGIQELDITLEWDATMSDLRALASAVTTANVAQMTMDGSHFKSPPLDVVNRGQRFNPILQLASNSRIQVFRLRGFENFGSRINKPALLSTPKLQLFTMELPENAKDMDLLFTNDILGHCLNLTTIELNLHPRCRIMKAISDILSKTRNIESLKVSRGDTLITAGDSKGMPKDMDMSMQQPEDPILHELKSMQNGRLCWMTVVLKDASRVELGDLKDILHHIPSLRHFRVGCPSFQSFFVVHNVIQTRRKIVEDTGSSCLRTFQLMNEDLIPFSPHGRGDLIQSYVSFQDNSTLLDMRTWIRGTDEEALLLMLIYRWSIVFFNTGLYGRQKCRDMLESINNSVELFQLEELWVAPDSTFLDSLHEIIRRSPMFKRLGLYVDLAQEADFEATRTILCQYGAILSTLHLSNYSFAGQQWSWFASSHPTRNSFPKLETLTLDSPSDTNLPSTCIPWVVAMVSAPSRVPIPSSHSQSSTEDTVDKQTPNVESEAQGSWTSLKRIDLCSLELPPEGWKSVIEAIDFSGLQILKFRKSNFSLKELELLVDCIPDDKTSNIPLQSLDISWTSAFSDPNSLPLLDELQRKAPLVAVYNEADTY